MNGIAWLKLLNSKEIIIIIIIIIIIVAVLRVQIEILETSVC